MRKIIFPTVTTFIVIALSYAVYYYNTSYSNSTTDKPLSSSESLFHEVTATQAAQNIQKNDELYITIASPRNAITVTQEDSIKFAAATKRNAVIAVLGGKSPVLRSVDSDGSFAPAVPLVEGINRLIVTAFDQNGLSKSQERLVVFTKDKLPEEFSSAIGTLVEAGDTYSLLNDQNSQELLTTNQTKLYSINNGTKKIIRNLTQFTPEIPVVVIYNQDKTANLVIQDLSESPTAKIFYAKVTNKYVTEDIFQLTVTDVTSKQSSTLLVTPDSLVTKNSDPSTIIRGSDIKIGDKILVSTAPLDIDETLDESEAQFTASHGLVIPGQASGVLRDVKGETSTSSEEN